MQEALSHIRTTTGETPYDEHIARLSPLMHGHINMLGHYTFTLPEDILKCSGQLKLATVLEFFQYLFSDSFGGNPPLYSCGLSTL